MALQPLSLHFRQIFDGGYRSLYTHCHFLLAIVLVLVYPRNPWVYPLVVISILHGIEHVYIFEQFTRTGLTNGPGLLGLGGAIGVIPLDRLDLHNVYNGFELILITLGFWNETEVRLAKEEGD